MVLLLLWLLSYPLTRGLLQHGVSGCLFLFLAIVHHTLNLDWYRALGRGRWPFRRWLSTSTVCLLLLCTLALLISSLAMAGEVFAFVPYPMPRWGRDWHTAATAWTFVLTAFHLGLHGQGFWNWLRRTPVPVLVRVFCALLFLGFSAWNFRQSGLWSDMLLYGEMKLLPESETAFWVQYVSIGMGFCLLGRLTLQGANRLQRLLDR